MSEIPLKTCSDLLMILQQFFQGLAGPSKLCCQVAAEQAPDTPLLHTQHGGQLADKLTPAF